MHEDIRHVQYLSLIFSVLRRAGSAKGGEDGVDVFVCVCVCVCVCWQAGGGVRCGLGADIPLFSCIKKCLV